MAATQPTQSTNQRQRVRLKKPDLTVLVSGKLVGKERRIGETITQAEWQTISPKMREVLIKAGRVGPLSALPPGSPAEAKASKQVKASQGKLKSAERLRDDLIKRQEELKKTLGQLNKERQPLAFAAAQGEALAQGKLETLREETIRVEIELADLNAALKEATREVEIAQRALALADSERYGAEALRLIKEQSKTCAEIQTLIEDELKPLIDRYTENQRKFAHAVPTGSTQVQSNWRLDSVLRRATGQPDLVRGNFKFDDLAEIETKIMNDALTRFRAKRKNEVKANGE